MKSKCLLVLLAVAATHFLTGCGSGVCTSSTCFSQSSSPSTGDDDDGASDSITYTTTLPSSERKYWVDDDSEARTLTFSSDADSVQCSRDAGSTFSACDSDTTFVWNASDYSMEHQVRFTKGTAEETYTFTPSSTYAGVSFLSCDAEVTADEDFDTFEARLGVAGQTICISADVTISNSGAQDNIEFSASSITIIGRHNETVTFESTRNSGTQAQQSVLNIEGDDDITLVGLDLKYNSGGAAWLLKTNSTTDNFLVEASTLENSSGSGTAYMIYDHGGGGSVASNVRHSIINGGTIGYGLFGTGAITLSNVTITGGARGISGSIGADITLENSTVTSSESSAIPIYLYRGSVSLDGVTVNDGSGNGAIELDDNGFPTTTLSIENTSVRRTTDNSGNSDAAIKISGTSTRLVNSTGNQNSFCRVGSNSFSAVQSGTHTGTFVDTNQENGGSVVTCE